MTVITIGLCYDKGYDCKVIQLVFVEFYNKNAKSFEWKYEPKNDTAKNVAKGIEITLYDFLLLTYN